MLSSVCDTSEPFLMLDHADAWQLVQQIGTAERCNDSFKKDFVQIRWVDLPHHFISLLYSRIVQDCTTVDLPRIHESIVELDTELD